METPDLPHRFVPQHDVAGPRVLKQKRPGADIRGMRRFALPEPVYGVYVAVALSATLAYHGVRWAWDSLAHETR